VRCPVPAAPAGDEQDTPRAEPYRSNGVGHDGWIGGLREIHLQALEAVVSVPRGYYSHPQVEDAQLT